MKMSQVVSSAFVFSDILKNWSGFDHFVFS